VNATTSFLLIFVSSKTVQYRRRHRLPKFDPENRFRVNSVSLFRPSVFRRGSTSTPCTVSNLFYPIQLTAPHSCSNSFVSFETTHSFAAAFALKSVHIRYLQEHPLSRSSVPSVKFQLTTDIHYTLSAPCTYTSTNQLHTSTPFLSQHTREYINCSSCLLASARHEPSIDPAACVHD
jgi:hypothetical protein